MTGVPRTVIVKLAERCGVDSRFMAGYVAGERVPAPWIAREITRELGDQWQPSSYAWDGKGERDSQPVVTNERS